MIKIQIRKTNVEISEVLRIHVERRLGLALARFADRIGRVVVRFSHADGEGGDRTSGAKSRWACSRCACVSRTSTRICSPRSITRPSALRAPWRARWNGRRRESLEIETLARWRFVSSRRLLARLRFEGAQRAGRPS